MNWYSIYISSAIPFNKNWPYHIDNTNQPDTQTMNKTPVAYNYINKQLLDTQSYAIEQMFPNATPFGAGGLGLVYDLHDGRILKLTTHTEEIKIAYKLKNKPNQYVSKIYDIVIIDQKKHYNTVWGIIAEKLIIPSSIEQNIIDDFLNSFTFAYTDQELQKIATGTNPLEILPVNYNTKNEYKGEFKYLKDNLTEIFTAYLQNIDKKMLFNILQQMAILVLKLKSEGFNPSGDPKGRNIGWKTEGNLAFLDLGFLMK